jgi:hypothetical protein
MVVRELYAPTDLESTWFETGDDGSTVTKGVGFDEAASPPDRTATAELIGPEYPLLALEFDVSDIF